MLLGKFEENRPSTRFLGGRTFWAKTAYYSTEGPCGILPRLRPRSAILDLVDAGKVQQRGTAYSTEGPKGPSIVAIFISRPEREEEKVYIHDREPGGFCKNLPILDIPYRL